MTLCEVAVTKPLTPLLAMLPEAQSVDPAVGLSAMTTFLHFWRPRVARCVEILHRGLRCPRLTREEFTEQSLVMVGTQLDACTAQSDSALHAWVSARTTQAVLELQFDARRLAHAEQRGTAAGGTGRAA